VPQYVPQPVQQFVAQPVVTAPLYTARTTVAAAPAVGFNWGNWAAAPATTTVAAAPAVAAPLYGTTAFTGFNTGFSGFGFPYTGGFNQFGFGGFAAPAAAATTTAAATTAAAAATTTAAGN